jgi:DNA-directed RNA polymerase subunit L
MPRIIKNPNRNDSTLEFTLSDVDVAYANGIRRTIIADIPVLAFNTSLKEKKDANSQPTNNCNIVTNTSRLNNEMIKQRLSCIPICINDTKEFQSIVDNCILEVNVENNTDEMLIVTTKDFKIKDIRTGNYFADGALRHVFPPYIDMIHGHEHYIQFIRLRPRISEEIPGEKISLTCKFSIETSKNDSSFNVAGTCTYKRTQDNHAILQQLHIKESEFKEKGLNDKEIEFEKKNWQLLDGMRIVVPNSFDFIIETVGTYSNERLVNIACKIINSELKNIELMLQNEEIVIELSNNTKPNCFEIYFENYDYTIGNIINQEMYNLFFNTGEIHSVSAKKTHPHNTYITMEVSIVSNTNPRENLIRMLSESCTSGRQIIKEIKGELEKMSGLNNK